MEWEDLEKKHPVLLTLKESYVWKLPEINKGWYKLVDHLLTELEEKDLIKKTSKVIQVKEKFGGLRFYIDDVKLEAHKVIEKYEVKSFSVCEKCGKPGKLRKTKRGWFYTACDECAKERLKEK